MGYLHYKKKSDYQQKVTDKILFVGKISLMINLICR